MTEFKLVSYVSITAFFLILVVIQLKGGDVNSSRDMSTPLKGAVDSKENQSVLAALSDELKQLKTQTSTQAGALNDLRQQSLENSAKLAANESTGELLISGQEGTPLDQDLSDEQSKELDPQQLKQAELELAKQVLSTLDNEMSREPYDDKWAPEMQETIATTLQNPKFDGSELLTVTCQSSLCRIEVEHDNADAEQEFLHNFVPSAGYTDTEVFFSRTEGTDGRSEMTYYISRDGQKMPSFEGV